jgi:hydrogenase maturation protein HypF
MEFEFAADPGERAAYPMPLGDGGDPRRLDWRPTLEALLADRDAGVPVHAISARFHGALAEGIVRVARAVGERTVVLSGGCFQNRLLLRRARDGLAEAGFRVLVHREVPCNDGGIALGQAAVASARAAAPAAG